MLSYWVLSKYRSDNGYIFNQSYCYILIIPGFGVISTTMSASSNKSVFGYLGILQTLNKFTNFEQIRRLVHQYQTPGSP